VVEFLPDTAAEAFSLRGGPDQIVTQLVDMLRSVPALDYVVLHPIPDPRFPDDPVQGYTARVARDVLPRVRAALARS
jgi:hypothetical protein